MPVYTFNHIHHETKDVPAAVDFYHRMFDATADEPVERGGNRWAFVRFANIQVTVTDRESRPTELGRLQGLDHFALTTDDFEGTLDRIRREGVPIWMGPLKQDNGQRVVFISGPDNIKIELMEQM